jgi:hypothetical protein
MASKQASPPALDPLDRLLAELTCDPDPLVAEWAGDLLERGEGGAVPPPPARATGRSKSRRAASTRAGGR